jgi:hypothetical protein
MDFGGHWTGSRVNPTANSAVYPAAYFLFGTNVLEFRHRIDTDQM